MDENTSLVLAGAPVNSVTLAADVAASVIPEGCIDELVVIPEFSEGGVSVVVWFVTAQPNSKPAA